jgi:mannitol 2-dehydrogenase
MARSSPIRLGQDQLGELARAGIPVPTYDRSRLRPAIVHVGVGGFHRAHLALYADELAARGSDVGIVGLGLLEQDSAMATALSGQDHLYTLIEKDGSERSARVVGSIVDYVHAPAGHDDAAAELIAAPETEILSMTVTEAGYAEPPAAGERTTFERLAAGLALRRDRSAGPITVLSCDNVHRNGDTARKAMLSAAARVEPSLPEWVAEHCTFPNAMVDRITPVTAGEDRDWLREETGIEDAWPVVSEQFRQWVMEDDFATARPAWEDVGAQFTERIDDWELYKLRILNAGHSSMAYLAALAGIAYVHEAMMVPAMRNFLTGLIYEEAMPTLAEIPGHSREEYAASVLERFANVGVRDPIARLCIDGSAKFPTFLLPTIEWQLARGGPIDRAATALAGWARYLAVVDAERQAFDASGDDARWYATAATSDPLAFLGYRTVFGPVLRASHRFRAAFVAAYEQLLGNGPLAALGAASETDGRGR